VATHGSRERPHPLGVRSAYPGLVRLDPGVVLADRFKVEAAVGAGGMSLVYSAIDLHSGERVAIKLM
jgi:serine/threonine protein kinase